MFIYTVDHEFLALQIAQSGTAQVPQAEAVSPFSAPAGPGAFPPITAAELVTRLQFFL